MLKFKSFVLKHPEFFTILGLCILFYFIFFHNIWAYSLMDVDESRYVSMSKDMFNTKDFLTLYLNKEYFFEKPPLYFWGECLSFAIFGKINEFTARFPVAFDGMICCFMVYFLGRKIISRAFGVVSSLIFGTSLEFVILAKFAILDIVLTTCITLSLGFGILVYFSKESYKKYFWWLFYIFSGLAVMAKGIPGFVIPFGSMFFISLYFKKFKELFKPIYCIPGVILFLLITLPWHIIMLQLHNPLFYNEYIIKHHIQRFIGGNELGREQPFYFYIITILCGFFPWIVSLIAVSIRKLVKKDYVFNVSENTKNFLVVNGIISCFILVFFSVSDTKLITYILPIYAFLACLGGYVWTNYIEKGSYSKVINGTVYIMGFIFIITSITACVIQYFIPAQLNADIAEAKPLCIVLLMLTGLLSIISAKKEKYLGVFFSYVLFMLFLSAFGTEKFFEVDYKFGQNDLIRFAKYAKEHNKTLTTYRFSHKYSLIYYADKPIEYGLMYDINDLQRELNEKDNLVIVRIKTFDKELNALSCKVIDKGRKYVLISK